MGKINVLEPAVFNKISAGEVVERPASIVKELIENSIDAGADRITLEITDGGISSIVVTDNGVGVHPDDIEKAFLPHATSKIKMATDLDNILTLGFRGEALASIAAVSQVEMISKTRDSVLASFIALEGGVQKSLGEKGATDGTKIIVNNLFFNMPVRAKFLKKPKQEENEITNLMTRMILANPDVGIKYIADGKTVFNSQGKGLEDAIFAVYGASTLQNLIPIQYTNSKYELTGFSSKTTYFKPNRTYQTLIINGRYVNNYLISQAVSRAYEQYMMKQAFPFFVLNLEIPIEELDVNVHPNKLDVRFEDSQAIFAFVYNALNDNIKYNLAQGKQELPEKKPTVSIEQEIANQTIKTLQSVIFSNQSESNTQIEPTRQSASEVTIEPIKQSASDVSIQPINQSVLNTQDDKLQNAPWPNGEILIEKLQIKPVSEFSTTSPIIEEKTVQQVAPKPVQETLVDMNQMDDEYLSSKIIGKVFNTFVLLENKDKLYLIDQHAAHERILFDALVKELNQNAVKKQGLLIPFTFDVNPRESTFIKEHMELLNSLGFEISQFGEYTYRIDTVPNILADIELGKFVNTMLSNVSSYVMFKAEDILRDKLAQYACKHAVKGGDDLNREELIGLIKNIATGDITMQCPHGRPFVVELTRGDLDKWFKRKL